MKKTFPYGLLTKFLQREKISYIIGKRRQKQPHCSSRCKSTYFKIKDQTKCEPKHNIVYLEFVQEILFQTTV